MRGRPPTTRRADPRRRLGRRTDRAARPDRLADRDAGHRRARNGRIPAPSCGSPTSTGTGSPLRHQHQRRAAPDLELRHRRRARAEDRIRNAKDTGLTNLPLHDFAQNQIWCALVGLAAELTAWMQLLALPGPTPAVGTQTAPLPDLHRRRPPRPHRPTTPAPPRRQTSWSGLVPDGIHRLRSSPNPADRPPALSDIRHPRDRGTRRPARRHSPNCHTPTAQSPTRI